MKLGDPKLWISGISIAVVAGFVVLDAGRTSPGPLASPHAQHPELAGAEGCVGCHGGFGGSLVDACCDCHESIDADVSTGSGLHGAVLEVEIQDCAACHSEHLGAEFELAGARAFELAGFERAAFDHGHLEFALNGAHDRLACEDCHPAALVPVLAEGQPRFRGLEQTCASCHEDPHEGTFARGCATCHGQSEPFAALASFEHGEAFPLVGSHADLSCAECHEPGSGRSIEVLAGGGPVPAARTCGECHESPHAEPFIAAIAELGARAPGATCALCHDAEGGDFTGPSSAEPLEKRAPLHAGSGLDLTGPHAEVGCAECHGESSELSFEARFPGRASSACAACHEDPHGGQFEGRLSCNVCHAEGAPFTPLALGVEEHALTAFPLLASHAETECAACHVAPAAEPDGPVVYAGTPLRCEACHTDVHAGVFEDPAVLARAAAADLLGVEAGCAACHQPTSFADVAEADFEHALWTAFELDGAHARAECAACHAATAQPDAAGRRFGRVSANFGPDVPACAACHEDVHVGAFDATAGGGPADCADCHTSESFELALEDGFDHGARTGFALEGAHERAECASCHGSGTADLGVDVGVDGSGGRGRRLGFVSDHYPGPPERCETCHTDPHGGGFDGPGRPPVVAGREGCARCHGLEAFASFDERTGGTGTSSASFDHGLWTGYALEGAHARASCTDCHARLLVPDARGRHLAPVPGRDCLSCHADPHLGQLTSAKGVDCASCHSSSERFDLLDFDHDRDTRFVLDEAHAPLECASCHIPWPLPDGREVVRYKPLGTRCIDCHDHGGPHGGGE